MKKFTKIEEGKKILDSLMPNGADRLINNLTSLAPDAPNYVLEFIFGTLYARSGLDLKLKQILTLTILATLGNARPQLEYHIKCARNIGITKEEIIDIFTHLSGYAGFPAMLNAIDAAKTVFQKEDIKESS